MICSFCYYSILCPPLSLSLCAAELEKRLKQRVGRQDLVERNILPRELLMYYSLAVTHALVS